MSRPIYEEINPDDIDGGIAYQIQTYEECWHVIEKDGHVEDFDYADEIAEYYNVALDIVEEVIDAQDYLLSMGQYDAANALLIAGCKFCYY